MIEVKSDTGELRDQGDCSDSGMMQTEAFYVWPYLCNPLYIPKICTDCIAEKGLPHGMTISSENLKILCLSCFSMDLRRGSCA